MIAALLTFSFGFLAALFLVLLVSPLTWRRAKSLARREFDATLPANANEIRASYDHVRARAVLEVRRREVVASERERQAATERSMAGRVAGENAEFGPRTKSSVPRSPSSWPNSNMSTRSYRHASRKPTRSRHNCAAPIANWSTGSRRSTR